MDLPAVAARTHDVCTAALALAIVPEPFGRRRRAMGFDDYVRHQQRADAVMRRLAPALSVAAMTTGTVAALTRPASAGWRLASVAAVAGAIVLTVRVHVPINERLRTWRPGAEAAGWREARARWERAHVVRRGLVVLAGAATAAARAR
ncbi:DUF1772 domain-containing protein [Kineococcus sp. SYSU DK002]|uniref:DUF1772 domain-containing protein n=1 Tax=Kineococcus sp. SYSU DK002 TaxID=3383123 RepID=UPI003D7F0CF1